MLSIVIVALAAFALGTLLAGVTAHFITNAKAEAISVASAVHGDLSARIDEVESKITAVPLVGKVNEALDPIENKAEEQLAPQGEAQSVEVQPAPVAQPIQAAPEPTPVPQPVTCATCGQVVPPIAANG